MRQELWPLPEGWRWVRLGEVARIFSGSPAPQDPQYFEGGKYPFVRVQDLGRHGYTMCLSDTQDKVNDLAVERLKLVKAKVGTILFPRSGAAIATNSRAILAVDAFIVSHLAAVEPKQGIVLSEWLYFWLSIVDMTQYSENPAYPSLKLSRISQIPVPLPPLWVQEKTLSEILPKLETLHKLKKALQRQLEAVNALPQAYLCRIFRGEVNS